eukprot:8583450-Pyramimonas_sp.AAC.1
MAPTASSDRVSGDPCQETLCLPTGCLGFLGFRWICQGKRDVPKQKGNGRPGVPGPGFLWRGSGGLASSV